MADDRDPNTDLWCKCGYRRSAHGGGHHGSVLDVRGEPLAERRQDPEGPGGAWSRPEVVALGEGVMGATWIVSARTAGAPAATEQVSAVPPPPAPPTASAVSS